MRIQPFFKPPLNSPQLAPAPRDWLHVLATTRLGENELHGAHRDRSFLAIDELPPDDVTCAAFLARLKKEGLEGLDTAASQSSEGVLRGEKRLSATLQPTLEAELRTHSSTSLATARVRGIVRP